MLVFDVQDVQGSLTTMLSLGARMDGAVQYTLDGSKVHSPYLDVQYQFKLDGIEFYA